MRFFEAITTTAAFLTKEKMFIPNPIEQTAYKAVMDAMVEGLSQTARMVGAPSPIGPDEQTGNRLYEFNEIITQP